MSKKVKEIVVVTGKYQSQDGYEKKRYKNIGSIFETPSGWKLKLDVVPLVEGGWNGWAFVNDPREDKYVGLPKDEDDGNDSF
jgi:hypothetical protein